MRILVLGANGRTGRAVITEALSRGYLVTALVRDPFSLAPHDGLAIVHGTPMEMPSIQQAFEATESGDKPSAVIVTLNSPRTSDNPFAKSVAPNRLLAISATNTLQVAEMHGVREIIWLSAFGVGTSSVNLPLVMKLLIKYSNLGKAYEDHEEVDKIMRQSDLNYVLVRPVVFNEKEKSSVEELGEEGKGVGMFDAISRSSVASFLVDAVGSKKWDQQAVVIRNS
ncbi:hypothetical protein BKA67DRAFT_579261 [Truncatella angustata]|uniref:NAD(P)-binding domain-containing protein n=1 Tax=Truncatella angustata TaxID=152316 RepID=A0A9P8UDQ4_9PEZI|nr:uncharacterized protein BKA67DRAFT_579261 [Truncatella angustata]KAH6648037.1 hypothetical protein BKA67DRAFT_579261 [Truncatella angustata]